MLLSCNSHGQVLQATCKAKALLYLDQQVVVCVVLNEADMAHSYGWVGFLRLDACRKLLHASAERLSVPLLLSRLQETSRGTGTDSYPIRGTTRFDL